MRRARGVAAVVALAAGSAGAVFLVGIPAASSDPGSGSGSVTIESNGYNFIGVEANGLVEWPSR